MRAAVAIALLIGVATMTVSKKGYAKDDKRADIYRPAFRAAERKYSLPHGLLERVAWQESRFNPEARSPVGAVGLMQFMPATAKEFGIDPLDPLASIDAAGKYFRSLYKMFGDWPRAIAAYNWGMGNVRRKGLQNAPEETREYYTSITSDLGLA